jgi:hypothetical protein
LVELGPPNNPPYFENQTLPKAYVGKLFTFRLMAHDPDNDTVRFTLVFDLEGMTVDQGGNLSWTPKKAGTYNFTVIITDGKINSSKKFEIVAASVNAPAKNMLEGMLPILLILIVILVLGSVGAMAVKRKRQPKPQPAPSTEAPAAQTASAAPAISAQAAAPLAALSPMPAVPAKDQSPAVEQPVIDDIFLIYKDGRLISHNTRKLKPDSDDQVLVSMFTAVLATRAMLGLLSDYAFFNRPALLGVKSGDIRDFVGTLGREKAEMGVFLTLVEPSAPMKAEAASAGLYTSPWDKRAYPKVQILTIEELLQDPNRPNPRCLQLPDRKSVV